LRHSSAETILDLDVSAQCLAHSAIAGPRYLQVHFSHLSDRSGVHADAFVSIAGNARDAALQTKWDLPERRWLSALFAGPTIVGKKYCQSTENTTALQMAYFRQQGVKLYINNSPDFGTKEMDAIGQQVTNTLLVHQEGPQGNQYAVGNGTSTPYWLQFSIPLHSAHSIRTTLRYQFP
jgi:hypothetical protein